MIGNKVKYRRWIEHKCEFEDAEGIVVDAWTEIKGTVKGDVFIGFGDVKGDINSKRIYKIEYRLPHSQIKLYEDVPALRLREILEYHNQETKVL